MKHGISKHSYELIKSELARHPEIEQAIIFGSRAMANYQPGSDIDLALQGDRLTAEIITRISQRLNQELPIPYQIDLLHINILQNQELRQHIQQRGKVF